ncbi:phage gp6-like head-tail connector protein [Streptococcus danieliae]|uniref:phage gp6-like head-tail connector protein n=1 Tax=Streptococcus danieliae TaxID=747656 RepID=UPI0030B858E5
MEEQKNHPLLGEFKGRMRIFHDADDSNLNYILDSSQSALTRLTGITDLENVEFKELIIERSRYVYHDQVEFFWENFQADILGLSIAHYVPEDDSEQKGDTDSGNKEERTTT